MINDLIIDPPTYEYYEQDQENNEDYKFDDR